MLNLEEIGVRKKKKLVHAKGRVLEVQLQIIIFALFLAQSIALTPKNVSLYLLKKRRKTSKDIIFDGLRHSSM